MKDNKINMTKSANFSTYRGQISIPTHFSTIGNIIKTTNIYTCREQVVTSFVSALANDSNDKNIVKNLDKSRLLYFGVLPKHLSKAYLVKVLKPIHLLEKECKLPKTKVFHVVHPNSTNITTVMFEGSPKWYRSSHTMSLWMLLLRAGMRNPATLYVESYNDLITLSKTFQKHPGTSGSNWLKEDMACIKETIHTWVPLMANLNEIFPYTVKWKDRFRASLHHTKKNVNHYRNSCAKEGIRTLGIGKSQHVNSDKLKTFIK